MNPIKSEFHTEIAIAEEYRNGFSICPECDGAGTDGTGIPWSGFFLDDCEECGGEGFIFTHAPEKSH